MSQIIFELIEKELVRQNEGIELIASENYASKNVRKACGSILTNKYAEGYPNRRYYGGCEVVDEIEQIAIDEACNLFGAKYANVQPHSGSQANAAAYRALLPNGGKILSLVLNDGGHLTHGSKVSFSSHFYEFVHYPLNKEGKLYYDLILDVAVKEQPDLLLAGYSAYPYAIDFSKLKQSKFDYIALGHIHKPEVLCDKMAYAGSLEPLELFLYWIPTSFKFTVEPFTVNSSPPSLASKSKYALASFLV